MLAIVSIGAALSISCCPRPCCDREAPAGAVAPAERPRPVAETPRGTLVGRVSGPGGPRIARVDVFLRRRHRPYVHGQYFRAAGRDEELEAPPVGEPPVGSVTSGADGAFRIPGLELGSYDVRAEAGADLAGAFASLTVNGERIDASMEVAPAVPELSGRAVYADGTAFQGVLRLSTAPWEHMDLKPGRASRVFSKAVATDAAGRFRVEKVPRRTLVVSAYAGGTWRWMGETIELPVPDGLVVRIGSAESRVAGRVLDQATGLGIEGATVRYVGAGAGGWTWGKTTTRADGTFEAPRSGDEGTRVLVTAPGYAPTSDFPTDGPARIPMPLTARLVRGARVAGRVTAPSGDPVDGLPVLLEGCLVEPAMTDAEGRFTFEDVPPGDWVVDARGRGWIPRDLRPRESFARMRGRGAYDPLAVMLRSSEEVTLSIGVVRGAAFAGRVLDASGQPVEGASVGIFDSDDDPGAEWDGIEPTAATVTDAEGAFRIDGLVEGASYRWRAEAAGFARGDGHSVATHGAEARTTLKLEVAPVAPQPPWPTGGSDSSPTRGAPQVLTGRVSYPDGGAAAGALVYAHSLPDSGSWYRKAITGADGSFQVTPPESSGLDVRVYKSDPNGDFEAKATVPLDQTSLSLTLALRQARDLKDWRVLRIVDSAGRLVPRVWMRVGRGLTGSNEATELEGGVYELGWTPRPSDAFQVWGARDEDGRPLPLGPARYAGWSSGKREIEVRLPPERTLAGIVRDAEGRGVGGVFVQAFPLSEEDDAPPTYTGERTGEARTRQDGRFTLHGLGDDDYLLQFETPPDLFPPRHVLARGGTLNLDVSLHRPVDVRVTVRVDEHEVVPGARVRAWVYRWEHSHREGWQREDEVRGEAVTDATGTCVLRGLDPEEAHALRTEPPKERYAQLGSSERLWQPRSGSFLLPRLGSIAGVVKDRTGRPAADVGIFVDFGDERSQVTRSAADGTFQADRLPAGPLTLYTAFEGQNGPPPDAPPTPITVGSQTVALEVDLGASLRVEVDRGGAPPEEGEARAVLLADGLMPLVIFGWDRFAFRGLKPETAYTLWLSPADDGKTARLDGVRAGIEPLRVTPVPGRTITGRIRVPAGSRGLQVTAYGARPAIQASGQANDEDGTYVISGLAAGMWTVHAFTWLGSRTIHAQGEVAAGGTLDLGEWTDFDRSK